MVDASKSLLLPAGLSDSGRPLLQVNEVECHLINSVTIEFENPNGDVIESASLRLGIVFLTTHRVLWIDETNRGAQGKRSYGLPLGAVASVHPVKKSLTKLWSSPRLRLRVQTTPTGELHTKGPHDGTHTASVVLVFKGQNSPDPFVARFLQVHQAKAWEADVAPAGGPGQAQGQPGPGQSASRFNPAMAGVSGILRKEQEQLQATDKNLAEAFSDLTALMAKAKDMVELAERMRAKLLAPASGPGGSEEEFGGSQQDMQDWLLSVGIASPVTKESAGALYHQQLARQLADFLGSPLQKAGGMLSMVDAYCLFNRARGTELISPDDMLKACAIWGTINVPITFRRFDSGVAVIQSKSYSDEEMLARLLQLVKGPEGTAGGVSASDAARALGLAPALAKEELLIAESRGLLCRDDSIDGLRFYHNFFREVEFYSQ